MTNKLQNPKSKYVTVIDYNMGNVRSVMKAFEMLTDEVVVSNKPQDIKKADHLVLPGVGAFADGMKNLQKLKLISLLKQEVVQNKKPTLAICLGMQLLAKSSQEFGLHKGLGWIDAEVKFFHFKDKAFKIPHVGWNNIKIKKENPLLAGIKQDSDFYFVHSYHLDCDSDDLIIATCEYGYEFPATLQKENIFATQFHPEKSQTFGLKILKNFLNYA